MEAPKETLLVVADLDGTLLEEPDGGWEEARSALDLLRDRGIPVVPCSSKTRAEILAIREEMGLDGPFIAENGGGLYWPGGSPGFPEGRTRELRVRSLGAPYPALRARFVVVRERLGAPITGFGDLDDEGIREATGLPPDRARLARLREFDEPFWFTRDLSAGEEDGILAALRTGPGAGASGGRELRVERGGRFHHLHGASDKGVAVRALAETWRAASGLPVRTAGIGDSPNDISLLSAVDQAWLVRRPDGSFSEETLSAVRARRADGIGPRGFARAVEELLSTRA